MTITTIQSEWIDNRKTLILIQPPLVISWAYKMNKSQGKTLDLAIIDVGKSGKCSGITLVTLYLGHKLSTFLLRSLSFERMQKVNWSNRLPITRYAYAELNLNFDSTK